MAPPFFQASVEALAEAPVWRLHGASMFTGALENCSFRWLCGSARGGARVAPPPRLHFHRCVGKPPIFKPPWRRVCVCVCVCVCGGARAVLPCSQMRTQIAHSVWPPSIFTDTHLQDSVGALEEGLHVHRCECKLHIFLACVEAPVEATVWRLHIHRCA